MRFLLALLLILLAACQSAPPPMWVNLYDECFDRDTFGNLAANHTPLYLDHDGTRSLQDVAHGEQIELVTIDAPMALVRVSDAQGYLPLAALSDYNPADGVKPNPAACTE